MGWQKREIENTDMLDCEYTGKWDIPVGKCCDLDIKEWQENEGGVCIGFNYVKSYKANGMDTKKVGVHFFLDDYQFERLWRKPSEYVDLLRDYKFVLSPDFSLFVNHPKAVQLFSHYKKQWLSAYWAEQGITVIPTICWSDSKSFEWCFDGVPKNSVVAVSTKGVMKNSKYQERFIAGYNQMIKRLQPKQVLLFGKPIGGLDGDIVYMGYEMQDAITSRIKGE